MAGREIHPTDPSEKAPFRMGVSRKVELSLKQELDDLAKKSLSEISAYKQAMQMEPLSHEQRVSKKLGPEFVPQRVREKRKTQPLFHGDLPKDAKTPRPPPPGSLPRYNPLEKLGKFSVPEDKTKKYPYSKEEVVTSTEMKKPHISSVGVVPRVRDSAEIKNLKVMLEGQPVITITDDDQSIGAIEIANTTPMPTETEEGRPVSPLTGPSDPMTEKKPAILGLLGTTQKVTFTERMRPTPRPMSQLSELVKKQRKISAGWRTRTRSGKSIASSLRSTEIILPDEAVFSQYDDVIANIDADASSGPTKSRATSAGADDQRSVSSTSSVKSTKELLDEAREIAGGEAIYRRHMARETDKDSKRSDSSKKSTSSRSDGKRGAPQRKQPVGKEKARAAAAAAQKQEPKPVKEDKPKEDRSVDEIINELRKQTSGAESEADKKIKDIMNRVMSRASAVLSEIGATTNLTTQEAIKEEEEDENGFRERAEREETPGGRSSKSSQHVDTYDLIVQSVLDGAEAQKAPRKAQRAKTDISAKNGEKAEDSDEEISSPMPEFMKGLPPPAVHVTAPTDSSDAAGESGTDPATAGRTMEKIPEEGQATSDEFKPDLRPVTVETTVSGTMKEDEESEEEEEEGRPMLYAEDLKRAYEDLLLPPTVTHEDIVSIEGQPSALQPRQEKATLGKTDTKVSTQPSAVSFLSSWAPVAQKEEEPSTGRDLSKNIHHFCTTREDIQLPEHLRGVGRKYHTPAKYGMLPAIPLEYHSRSQSSIKPSSFDTAVLLADRARERDHMEREQSAAAQRILEEAYQAAAQGQESQGHLRAQAQPSGLLTLGGQSQQGDPDSFEAWQARAQQVFDESDLFISGAQMPIKSDESRLYWTPAPPKMDVPPAKVQEHLFANYHSAALMEQEEASQMHDSEEEEDMEEESIWDDTDPEDRLARERVLQRRHDSAADITKLMRAVLEKAEEEDREAERAREQGETQAESPQTLVKTDSLATLTTASSGSSFFFQPTVKPAEEEDKTPKFLTDDEIFPVFPKPRRTNSMPNLYGDDEDFLFIPQDFSTAMDEITKQMKQIKEAKLGKKTPVQQLPEEVIESESGAKTGVARTRSPTTEQRVYTRKQEYDDKPTLAEEALEAGRKYVMYPKRKKKKMVPLDMARLEEIERFLAMPPGKLERTESLPKVNVPVERLLRVPQYVKNKHRRSIPDILDFDSFAEKRGYKGEDEREWTRDIWNAWFDEVFPPTQSERDEDEARAMSAMSSTTDRSVRSKGHASVVSTHISEVIDEIEPLADTEENAEAILLLQDEVEKLSELISQSPTPTAFDLCRRGAIYRKLGQIKLGLEDLDRAIALEPMLLDAYWHRHLLHLLKGKKNDALEDLNFLLRHSKQHAGAYRSRAEIYRESGDVTMAIVNFNQAIKLDPNDHEAYYRRAEMYEKSGEMRLALEDYAIATRLAPEKTEALFKHGLYYFNSQNWQPCINDFTDLLKVEPNNAEARTYRGRAFAKMSQWTPAIEDLSAAIHLDPNNSVAHYHRGCLLRKLQPKKALQDLSVSIILDDGDSNVMAYFHRGILYNSTGRPEDAIPDFETVLKLDKDIASAHVNLGLIYMTQLDNVQNAIRKFSAAIKVDPTYIRAYVCRAEAYHRIHDHRNALLDFTRAIHLKPDTHHYYMYRGQLVLEMGNLELAAFCVRHASELNAGLGQSPMQQAVVQSFLKNYDKAIGALESATRQKPVASLFTLLGKTQMKAKLWRNAIGNFDKALGILKPWSDKDSWPHEAAEVHYLIGMCNMELRGYLEAHEAFNNAIKVDGTNAEAFYQRGLSRIRLKQGKGIQDFNRALALDPKIFQVYLSRAAYYGLRGQYSKAILNCNEAIKLQPNSVRAYLFRGALKYHIKAYQLAIRDLTKATSIDSTCALAYFNRAVCYHDSKNHAKALQDYGIVLLLGDALRLKVLINRGLLYFDRDDYRNALQDFLLAAKIDAKNCKIYHTIGLCYHKLNCLEDAVKAFSVALTLDKFFLEGYIGRGNVLMDYGHDAGLKFARRDYERALQLNPIYLPARVNLAYNLQVCGKYMHAWRQFTAALTANPYYKPALEGRAIVNLQMSDTFAAFQDINASVRVVPSAELLTNRGVIHQFMGDKANAMRDYQQAISIDPSHALAYFNAANIYFQMRQFKQAHAHYDKAILFNPKDESALLNRAITKVLLRDSAGALDDFKAAVKLSPHSAHMYFNRGNLYSSLKQFDKAEKDYTKALTLQPDDALVYKRRADVRGKLGKKAEAIADYKYAIEIQSKKRATIDANSVTFKPGSHSK
ncbi:uncharacterized protein LOC106177489 [Lingula anatina]|uniref:Uncharacterized protein LOC106177489 n=1 Tax=Lingula anatina TaxID=7574 RepID=A0A1S3JZA6_LINAN|nr:uncharacterized protein LOC106177489 [Lingula anatina]|eukprot:XP_013415730.1 uncharacterized protein LOC106177489 [Lingula anatina]